jgi:2-polyprenyl-6-methoxyphenol hydroxylase-like FAD-dependent oxidoreductase
MRVLVAGGGIGGLVLALALHERGIECTVFEAAARVEELGVGINLLPHAVSQLAALDLLPELDAGAIRTRELRYLTPQGQQVWSQPCGLWAGHPVPQLSIHRGRLRGMLWQAAVRRLGPAAVLSDRRLVEVAQDRDGVTVRFADGSHARGDCLVGADGIHSQVRRWLHPDDGGIRWNGMQMWRGATEWPAFEGGDTMVIAGGMAEKFVLYPIAPGSTRETRLTNWAVCVRLGDPSQPPPRREDWSRPGLLAEVLPQLDRFRIPLTDVAALVRATPRFFEFPMCDRDPLPWWTRGRVTLLGDAAHPLYPAGSNGAAQAILDARCLATMLADHPVETALGAYERQRLAPTTEIVHSNRRGGPERMIDLVTSRAPHGFDRLEDVVTHDELHAIATGYHRITNAEDPTRTRSAQPRPHGQG